MPRHRQHPAEQEMTAEDFIALPNAEKDRIYQEIDRQTPEEHLAASGPLTRTQRTRLRKFRQRVGPPKIGKRVKVISLSVEKRAP